jgi:hypothetical protein
MAILYPDILQHNNPTKALVDSSQLRGSAYVVNILADTGSIPTDKWNLGAIIYVSSSMQHYGFFGPTTSSADWNTSAYWKAFSTGSGGGGGTGFPYTGNAIISGSLLVSGSGVTITGSLNVLGGITGSLQGTASNAVSSSYATTASYFSGSITSAISASFATTASYAPAYVLTSVTASMTVLSSSNATTASYYKETDPVFTSRSASLATTGSNTFIGNQIITGSLIVNGNIILPTTGGIVSASSGANIQFASNGGVSINTVNNQSLQLGAAGSSYVQITGGNGLSVNNISSYGPNAVAIGAGVSSPLIFKTNYSTEQMRITASGSVLINTTVEDTVNKLQVSGSGKFTGNLVVTGSLNVLGGITGSLFGSASYATTASYVPNVGNQVFPYTGNAVISGSLLITGSGLTITGSLNITGSTTQVGNNTLYGTTLLSGSITISGSITSPTTPSVKIYGDVETNGVIKFDPVVKSIDTSISASYIYVSGSTQDLYFSQNGSGYANTTRLRWLESVLYTGILNGGVISSTPGSTTFTITSGSGLIVTLNASTASNPYPTVKNISWNTQTLPITYSGSAKITYIGVDNTGTVIQQTNPWGSTDINQWDNSISIGVVLTLSGSVSTGIFNSPQISYGPAQKTDDFFRAFGPLKISGHTLQASGSTMSIIKSAGSSYREGANYVNNPNHPSTVVENSINTSKIYRYYLSGSTPIIDTGVANAGYTVIDPTKYVNTSGQLATVPTNGANLRYTIQRVFWISNSPTNAFIVYYGSTLYASLLDASNGIGTEPFTEAPNTAQNSILIGYIIVAGNATDLTNASQATIVQGGLFRNVGGIGSSGTNFVSATLAGLSDVSVASRTQGDLLVYGNAGAWNSTKQLTGSYAITGSLSIGSSNITTNTITSAVGSNTIFTQVTGSYSSAFYKYSIASASNARAGEIMAVWNGASVQYTDNSTPDIGNTSAVTSSVSISGANVVLSTYTPAASWTIKSYVTYI